MPLRMHKHKSEAESKIALRRLSSLVLLAGVMLFVSIPLPAQSLSARDRDHQPERVMDAVGLLPGMVVGEVGAGHGYFTFWLAGRVGPAGKVYANDISRSALSAIQRRCRQEDIGHIETILGEVEDPLFPDGALDMVFIVNAFHDLEKPVELLNNLLPSLKPGATVVIMDRDPEKFSDPSHHFLTKEEILAKIAASRFVLDRMETFLPHHGLYILRPKAPKSDMISQLPRSTVAVSRLTRERKETASVT